MKRTNRTEKALLVSNRMKTTIKTAAAILLTFYFMNFITFNSFAQVANGTGAGNCLNFDGVNDYVNVGTFNPISGNGGNVTMEAWVVKYTNVGQYIFTKGNDNQANSYGILMSGNVACVMTFGSGAGYAARWACSPAGSILPNTWNHIVGVIQGSSMSLYINGKLAGSNTVLGTINTSTLPVWIGGQNRSGYYYNFDGYIDEVRTWNRALTETEIRQNMCKKLTGSESGLVGYWRFDEGSGSTAYDSSPNGNNGTINGATQTTSGAAIGDTSTFLYPSSWTADSTLALAHPDGDELKISNVSGSPHGVHIYRIDAAPSDTTGINGLNSNNRYFGAFTAEDTTPTFYTATYNYNGNPFILYENGLQLYKRNNNANTLWINSNAAQNATNNTFTIPSEEKRGEYLLEIADKPSSVCPLDLGKDSIFFCQGQTFTLYADSGFVSYSWSTSATTQTISVNTTGIYSVIASDNTGCSNSDTTIVTVYSNPLIPVITKNGNNLTSNATTGNQWYRNDTLLTGDTLQNYTALINGNYKVIVTDAYECSATSSGVSVNVGINDKYQAPSTQFQVFPNPSDGNFELQFTNYELRFDNAELRIYNVLGEKVYQTEIVNHKSKIQNLKSGVYFLQLITDEGVWNKKIIVNYLQTL